VSRFSRRARRLLYVATERKVDMWSGLTLIAWSALVFANNHALLVNLSHMLVTELIDTRHWIRLVFCVGLFQVTTVIFEWQALRIIVAGVSAWIYAVFGWEFIMGAEVIAPAMVLYFGWSCTNIHIMLRGLIANPHSWEHYSDKNQAI